MSIATTHRVYVDCGALSNQTEQELTLLSAYFAVAQLMALCGTRLISWTTKTDNSDTSDDVGMRAGAALEGKIENRKRLVFHTVGSRELVPRGPKIVDISVFVKRWYQEILWLVLSRVFVCDAR